MTQEPELPHDREAEIAVLGSMVIDNSTVYAVQSLLTADDFYNHDNRVLFQMIAGIVKAGGGCDIITLVAKLRQENKLEQAGGYGYVVETVCSHWSSANVENHARIIKNLSKRRQLIKFADQLNKDAMSSMDAADLMASVSARVNTLLSTAAEIKSVKYQETIQLADAATRRAAVRRATGKISGVPWGIPAFDSLTGGFGGPRLIILAARPKCAKSALAWQGSQYAAKSGHPGFYLSTELDAEEMGMRGMAHVGQVNLTRLSRGHDDEYNRGTEQAAAYGDIPLWFNDQINGLDAACAEIAMHKFKFDIGFAVVDMMSKLRVNQRFNGENDRLGHISWTLKQLAKHLKIPIIALCHLGRDCDKENRRPRADDLRDSGNIEQDADAVIMVHIPLSERNSGKPKKKMEIGIPINRTGPAIWLSNEFELDGPTQTITQDPPREMPGAYEED